MAHRSATRLLDAGEMNRKYGGKHYRETFKKPINDILDKGLTTVYIRFAYDSAFWDRQTYVTGVYSRAVSERIIRQQGKVAVLFEFRPLNFSHKITQVVYTRNVGQREEEKKELRAIVERFSGSVPPERKSAAQRRFSYSIETFNEPRAQLGWGLQEIYGGKPNESVESLTGDSFFQKLSTHFISTGVQTHEAGVSWRTGISTMGERPSAALSIVEQLRAGRRQPSDDMHRRNILDSIRTLNSRRNSKKFSASIVRQEEEALTAKYNPRNTPVTLATSAADVKALGMLRSMESYDILPDPKGVPKPPKPATKPLSLLIKKPQVSLQKSRLPLPLAPKSKASPPEAKKDPLKLIASLWKKDGSAFAKNKPQLAVPLKSPVFSTKK